MPWYASLEMATACGSGRVGRGLWSDSLVGSLFDLFSGVGDCVCGDWSADVFVVDILALLASGCTPFGGLPGPRLEPDVGS